MEYLEGLSKVQREAVITTEGPSLIIAGAGSGKTRVLTFRIAHLLKQGVQPWSILALTFTNKAANEMKERIARVVGNSTASSLWMGTFHSMFLKILRVEAHRLGYSQNFTIYDTSDTKSLLTKVIKDLRLDPQVYKPSEVYNRISSAKNNLITPQAYASNAALVGYDRQTRKPEIHRIYAHYAQRCLKAAAMDFDDLLLNINILFLDFPEVLAKYQSKFKYILVDEYQDTNYSQYIIVKKLAAQHHNVCVVGDDAQSIYAFRGAKIENILNFKNDYSNFNLFKLEQNYRSTQTIVNAANSVIAHNAKQLQKVSFSAKEVGDRVKVIRAYTDQEEGFMVASAISDIINREHVLFSQIAILYRTNSQSRIFEEALRKRNIPYRIYAGHSFYERKEIKDVLAYFRLTVNPNDDEAFRRIVNFPARGIGDTTMERIDAAANELGVSIWSTLEKVPPETLGIKTGIARKISDFMEQIRGFATLVFSAEAYEAANSIVLSTGLLKEFRSDGTNEGISRLQNIEELLNGIREFVENQKEEGVSETPTLADYLETVSLLTDADKDKPEDRNKVSLMTVHSAKGLEFDYVFLTGMEEELFPSSMAFNSPEELEEERRLFYVGLTRAAVMATISFAQMRFKWGNVKNSNPSRFIKEINPEYLEQPVEVGTNIDNHSSGNSLNFGKPVQNSATGNYSGSNFSNPFRKYSSTPKQTAESSEVLSHGDLQPGTKVAHERFGEGVVVSLESNGGDTKAIVEFKSAGQKTLLLKYAKLRVLKH